MDTVTFNKSEVIFKQGDIGKTMYKIISGTVGIYVNYAEAGEKLLVDLSAGKYFGEMAMLENLPRSATAVATSDAELECIDKDGFDDFITRNPAVATGLLTHVFGRLRTLTGDYMEACKTLAEVLEAEDKPKKAGLWAKIKKYAKEYSDASANLYGENDYINNYMLYHTNFLV